MTLTDYKIMSKTVIFHNPRCSKSRATLAILEDQKIEFSVVKYLDSPLNESGISKLLTELNLDIRDILRKNETDYKEQEFSDPALSDAELITKLSQFPKVMERPIVSHLGNAAIGRPPENVLSLFK